MRQYGLLFIFILVFFIQRGEGQSAKAAVANPDLDSLMIRLQRLEARIDSLKELQQEGELERLRQEALQLSGAPQVEKAPTEKVFTEKSRSLQSLNPEISVTGDAIGRYRVESPHSTDEMQSGFLFRVFGIHIQSNLDPFSIAKASVELGEEGIELTEAYITWTNPLPRATFTLGRFRQQFGVINRWHEHALDQTFFPLPIQMYMGEEGLSQVGVSLNWLPPPVLSHATELTLQVTNSENEALFNGERWGLPATLIHLKNYYDLSRDTYFEWGVSGLAGTNDTLGWSLDKTRRWTYLAGLDFTLSWTPARRALYRGLTWRTELFYLHRDEPAGEVVKALGGFSYVDYRLSRRIIVGLRVDAAQPPVPENRDLLDWQIVPYVTFWQSEYVYLRFQWNHLRSGGGEEIDNRLMVQVDWAMGPHKHEKY